MTEISHDYVFGNALAGSAVVTDKEEHVEMRDLTGDFFHDEIRRVTDDILAGKYYSKESFITRWLPPGPSFLHVDKSRGSVYLPYVLRRIGDESAYRNRVG